jgi:hypothetical protein
MSHESLSLWVGLLKFELACDLCEDVSMLIRLVFCVGTFGAFKLACL